MQERFKKIEEQFLQLRKDYKKQKLTEREFKDRLKQLRITDKNGRCWTIGAKTGKWYYYDGKEWVEASPPALQKGKAVCTYSGFENDIRNQTCDYCGGDLTAGEQKCPKCGCDLVAPSQECPECEEPKPMRETAGSTETGESQEFTESFGETGDTFEAEPPEAEKDVLFEQCLDTSPEAQVERAVFPDDGGPNSVLRSVSPVSVLMFMGILGTIVGIVMGVFVGISNFFMATVRSLPPGIQSMHGSLFGGVVYGLLGGLFGFVALGAFGFVWALLTNLVLSFFGGINVRIDKTE